VVYTLMATLFKTRKIPTIQQVPRESF
jgi:hypothetical protein